jgi:hypothetical protein
MSPLDLAAYDRSAIAPAAGSGRVPFGASDPGLPEDP